jgi:hypothetical protein
MKGTKCILRLVRVCNFRMEQQLKMAKELCVPSVPCMLSNLAATSSKRIQCSHRDDRAIPPWAASTPRPERAHWTGYLPTWRGARGPNLRRWMAAILVRVYQ